jgi:hypothetical protein
MRAADTFIYHNNGGSSGLNLVAVVVNASKFKLG